MPCLRSGKNIDQVFNKKKKKKLTPLETPKEPVVEAAVEPVKEPVVEAVVEPVQEALEETEKVVEDVKKIVEDVKEIVQDVKEIGKDCEEVIQASLTVKKDLEEAEFIEISKPEGQDVGNKTKSSRCIIC